MKLLFAVVAVFCLFGLQGCLAKVLLEEGRVPVFVESLKRLQRGPPEMKTKGRVYIATEIITQKLDHFDENNTETWRMRYMANDNYFKSGGPIFIYIGGEWEISAGMISSGHLVDMARDNNGSLFYTEHRYYGQSYPTRSITTKNLKYLHVKQALADLAHFIRTIKQTVPGLENSKVILAGGSYSATMVVWFNRLYPELMDGGWASSAPLFAKVDFQEYKEVVGRSFVELGSQACYNRIQNGIFELESLINEEGGPKLMSLLKLCNNFDVTNELDVWSLFSSISNTFAGIAQYQTDTDIPYTCDYLMWYEDDLTAMTKYLQAMWGEATCYDVTYALNVDYYLETSYYYGASRPWFYQTCNEYGWYQSSTSKNQPFGSHFPAKLYTTMCRDVFADSFTDEFIEEQVAEINNDFGGFDPQVENVYMTHGSLDPWNPMGLGESDGATVIPLASHCADFDSIRNTDTPAMVASKKRLAELVRGWVSNK